MIVTPPICFVEVFGKVLFSYLGGICGAYAFFYSAELDSIPPVTKLKALLKKPCF